MQKIYFYDTCALLDNPMEAFKRGHFWISSITLNELEDIKTSGRKDEETKYNARKLLHLLEENDNKYSIMLYNTEIDETIKMFSLPLTNDSKIIASAYELRKSIGASKENFIFCTKDLACKAIAKSCDLEVNYETEKLENEYTGFKIIQLNEKELAEFYSETLYKQINCYNLVQGQYLVIKNNSGEIIDKYKWDVGKYTTIPYRKAESRMFGKVVPKDIYQQLGLDALASNKITMLRGSAGSGKSYLSFAYMFSLLEQNKIEKIIIFCNTVATKGSAKLGFYPGSRDEKLLDSQIGNLLASKLGDKTEVERMIQDGILVLLPMSDIRGYDTTGMNAAVYISEAQNLDIELMRLALQRIGEDSICILDGDSNAQVDSSLYAGSNNGMRRVSEVFKGTDIYGEVKLQTIHRSRIAELAQKM